MQQLLLTLSVPACICLIGAITAVTIARTALADTKPQERAAILCAIAALIRALRGKP